jgi:glutaredoxin
MINTQELKRIARTEYAIFSKANCPFFGPAKNLFDHLVVSKIIPEYSIYILNKDFTNQQLRELCLDFGWQPDGEQDFPSKPQIFMKGEYIGGNFEFYRSSWNIAKNMPNLKNPMRF